MIVFAMLMQMAKNQVIIMDWVNSDVMLKELYDFLDASILVQTDAEVLNQPIWELTIIATY